MRSFFKQLFIICFLFLFFSSSPTYASDFRISRDATFSLNVGSDLKAAEIITIINQAPGKYASSYEVSFNNTSIKDLVIVADEKKQALTWTEIQQNNSKLIKVELPANVGKNKEQRIILSYTLINSAIQQGQMTEITIPNLHTPEINDLKVTIEVPANLGAPAYTSSSPSLIKTEQGQQVIQFNNLTANSSLRLMFGDHQVYQFALFYHLEHARISGGYYQLTLPPDTNYQQVALTQLSQTPHSIVNDQDGNWIAKYPIQNTNSPVVITGSVMVVPKPIFFHEFPPSTIDKNDFWKSDDRISKLASDLKTPNEIYSYVKDTLQYNYQKLGNNDSRLGAIESLNQPQNANCMEFTDLFISIANTANLPSRRIVGYANSNNVSLQPLSYEGDILHSWPEYYLNSRWNPVDPTWGHTTQGQDYINSWDTQHVTLAINRQFDSYPLPPVGSQNSQSRNIIFTTASNFPTIEPILRFEAVPGRYYLPFVKPIINIYVSNLAGIAKYNLQITDNLLDNIKLSPIRSDSRISILPFSRSQIPFKLNHRWWLPPQVIIEADGQIITLQVPFIPRLFNIAINIVIIFLYIGVSYITIRFAIQTWNLRLPGFTRKNSLHRQSHKSKKQG